MGSDSKRNIFVGTRERAGGILRLDNLYFFVPETGGRDFCFLVGGVAAVAGADSIYGGRGKKSVWKPEGQRTILRGIFKQFYEFIPGAPFLECLIYRHHLSGRGLKHGQTAPGIREEFQFNRT